MQDVQVAIAENGSYQVELHTLDTAESAVFFFENNVSMFPSDEKSATSKVSSSTLNSQNYEITIDGTYYFITRIDNTVLYGVNDRDYKKEIREVKKSLGY